jgi:hypothetical protein
MRFAFLFCKPCFPFIFPTALINDHFYARIPRIMCQKFHIACLRARISGKLKISLRRDSMYADSKLLLEQLPAMQLRKRLAVAFSVCPRKRRQKLG